MPQQAERYEADAWEDNIRDYVEPKSRVTVGEVGRHALGIETARIGTADQRRIAAALEQLGWKRQKQSWDGKRWWTKGYVFASIHSLNCRREDGISAASG
jgi:predicted P-loop ATPase